MSYRKKYENGYNDPGDLKEAIFHSFKDTKNSWNVTIRIVILSEAKNLTVQLYLNVWAVELQLLQNSPLYEYQSC